MQSLYLTLSLVIVYLQLLGSVITLSSALILVLCKPQKCLNRSLKTLEKVLESKGKILEKFLMYAVLVGTL